MPPTVAFTALGTFSPTAQRRKPSARAVVPWLRSGCAGQEPPRPAAKLLLLKATLP